MKLIKPGDRVRESPGARKRARRDFPASRWRYITLECEHITTPETQEALAAFRTDGFPYLCEKCGTPQHGQKTVKPLPQPDEPPF